MKILLLISHPAHRHDVLNKARELLNVLGGQKPKSYRSLEIKKLKVGLFHTRLTATVSEDEIEPVIDDLVFHTSAILFGTAELQPVSVSCCVLPD